MHHVAAGLQDYLLFTLLFVIPSVSVERLSVKTFFGFSKLGTAHKSSVLVNVLII